MLPLPEVLHHFENFMRSRMHVNVKRAVKVVCVHVCDGVRCVPLCALEYVCRVMCVRIWVPLLVLVGTSSPDSPFISPV